AHARCRNGPPNVVHCLDQWDPQCRRPVHRQWRCPTRRGMRVLHLVNWYPNVLASGDAPFVARHVEALRPFVEHQEVWHIECRRGNGWRWVSRSLRADRTTLLVSPLRRWRLIETIGTLLVVAAWTRWKGKGR